jgi:hypothetical protein
VNRDKQTEFGYATQCLLDQLDLKVDQPLLTGTYFCNLPISLSNGFSFAREAEDNLRTTRHLEPVDYRSALLCSPAHCQIMGVR